MIFIHVVTQPKDLGGYATTWIKGCAKEQTKDMKLMREPVERS